MIALTVMELVISAQSMAKTDRHGMSRKFFAQYPRKDRSLNLAPPKGWQHSAHFGLLSEPTVKVERVPGDLAIKANAGQEIKAFFFLAFWGIVIYLLYWIFVVYAHISWPILGIFIVAIVVFAQVASARERKQLLEQQKKRAEHEAEQKRLMNEFHIVLKEKAKYFEQQKGYITWFQCPFRNRNGSGMLTLGLFSVGPPIRILFGYIVSAWDRTVFADLELEKIDIVRVDYVETGPVTVLLTRNGSYPGIELYWSNRDCYYQIVQCLDTYR